MGAAERLAEVFADTVGAVVRSVILHGSLAAGGFRPGRSDIDVLAVVDGGLAQAQAEAIEGWVRRAEIGGAAGVDLHVVTAGAASTPGPGVACGAVPRSTRSIGHGVGGRAPRQC